MPYIPSDKRNDMDAGYNAQNVGQLTYQLTRVAILYLEAKGQSYQTYAEILGALEATKLELYRRSIGPYEDTKIKENGDVYPSDLLGEISWR